MENFTHLQLKNFTGIDSDKAEQHEQEGIKKASSGKTIILPYNPSGVELETKLKKLGYTIHPNQNNNTKFKLTLPSGWKVMVSETDGRHMEHVDENNNIRANLFVKDSSYDPFVTFCVCEAPFKSYKKEEDSLKEIKMAMQNFEITMQTTYGHPCAQMYIDSAYDKLVEEYQKLNELEKLTIHLPSRPVARKSFW